MEARYPTRKNQLLQACQVAPEIFHQVMPRWHTFMDPFVAIFPTQTLTQQARTSVSGLRSDVERTNVASIAYRFGQDACHCNAALAGQTGMIPRCARS